MKTGVLAIVGVVLLCHCGGTNNGGGGETSTLTCAWLQGDNCWTEMLGTRERVHGSRAGALATDRASCSYASGARVTFASAVPVSVQDYDWRFDVRNGATLCVGLEEDGDNFAVQTTDGKLSYEVTDGNGVRITCPNGARFEAPYAVALLTSCGAQGFPSRGYAAGANAILYTLGVTNDSARTVELVDCRLP